MLAYVLKIAEANPNVLPYKDALSMCVIHPTSKKALEGRFILPIAVL